jgi:hypothetical protein
VNKKKKMGFGIGRQTISITPICWGCIRRRDGGNVLATVCRISKNEEEVVLEASTFCQLGMATLHWSVLFVLFCCAFVCRSLRARAFRARLAVAA